MAENYIEKGITKAEARMITNEVICGPQTKEIERLIREAATAGKDSIVVKNLLPQVKVRLTSRGFCVNCNFRTNESTVSW